MSKTFDQGKEEVAKLCRYFGTNRQAFLAPGVKEAHIRQSLIDPLFESLGWDVRNTAMTAPQYREVIPEDSLDVEGQQKAPDYTFRVGPLPKFYAEAKKCGVNIGADPGPAYQLRRYGWSGKVALSVLTDFEEFGVYDCTMRPRPSDKASHARIQYLRFDEYPDRWRELWDVFSREAVWSGAFDQYAASKRKRGTSEVDVEFLKEIEGWRDALARDIALRNKDLSSDDLNAAVQLTIDRVVFLRMAEDRGLEPYEGLLKLCERPGIYPRFMAELCHRADQKYNSGLFHFQRESGVSEDPDRITPKLTVDDKVFKPILESLYFAHGSPYHFGVVPVEILGTVYERFLGKVIRLTAGHQAKVEEKPEVRKAGGVYYTPAYIVEYIVKHTVGRQIEGRSPAQLAGSAGVPAGSSGRRDGGATFRVLDMACGSGSFLLGAYQCLLDHCLKWYIEHKPETFKKAVYKDPRNGEWRLTIEEKKRILTTHIFGVDIDPQAVEVSKLSLLLKVLEGETDQSFSLSLLPFGDRALPNLADNIKCGNSLVGPDYFTGKLIADPEEMKRVNPFDWSQGFPDAIKAGGFDCVIGNPPYVRQESLSNIKEYLKQNYEAFDGVADLYAYFMEQGVKLLRDGGLFSIIVSSSFLRATYGEPLRRTLKRHGAVLRIVDFGGLAVFANAKDTYVCIPLLQKGAKQDRVEVAKVESLDFTNLTDHVSPRRFTIPSEQLSAEAWALKTDEEVAVFAKITKAGKPLGDYLGGRVFYGIKTGLNDAFIIDGATRNQLIEQDKKSAELIKPLLGGEDIRRYIFHETGLWLIFTRRGVDIDRYPAIRDHLERWKEDLTPKRNKSAKKGRKPGRYAWHEIQDDVAYYEVFDGPKLIYPDIAKGPRFCLDVGGHYLANTAYCLGTEDRYLLGVLNSRLFWFAIGNISIPFGVRAGQYRYRLIYQYMEKVPIRVIDFSNSADKSRHDRIVILVDSMLGLHERLAAAKSAAQKAIIQRQIEATDAELDRLVYDLYGLTAEEIAVVERNDLIKGASA
jgi:predicted type IV restriction endonuclease